MKVLMPPLKDIYWPANRNWIGTYLSRGMDGLRPKDYVNIAYQIGIDEPTRDDVDQFAIYTLTKMDFSLGAIKEFFRRHEVKPKPDVDALYAKAVGMLHSDGIAPILEDTPFYQFLRLLALYLKSPSGVVAIATGRPVKVNVRKKTVLVLMSAALKVASTEAMRSLRDMPDRNDVIRDLKRSSRRDYIVDIATYGRNNIQVTLDLDWMIRHGLVPKFLEISACVRRK